LPQPERRSRSGAGRSAVEHVKNVCKVDGVAPFRLTEVTRLP
jgi:hypothetical protein